MKLTFFSVHNRAWIVDRLTARCACMIPCFLAIDANPLFIHRSSIRPIDHHDGMMMPQRRREETTLTTVSHRVGQISPGPFLILFHRRLSVATTAAAAGMAPRVAWLRHATCTAIRYSSRVLEARTTPSSSSSLPPSLIPSCVCRHALFLSITLSCNPPLRLSTVTLVACRKKERKDGPL